MDPYSDPPPKWLRSLFFPLPPPSKESSSFLFALYRVFLGTSAILLILLPLLPLLAILSLYFGSVICRSPDAAQQSSAPLAFANDVLFAVFCIFLITILLLFIITILHDVIYGPEPPEYRPGAPLPRLRAPHGLDPAVINGFPTVVYSSVKGNKIGKASPECAVCLKEFEDHHTLRLIPACDHAFHPECIGEWLASHTTCPVCRADLKSQLAGHASHNACPVCYRFHSAGQLTRSGTELPQVEVMVEVTVEVLPPVGGRPERISPTVAADGSRGFSQGSVQQA